AVLAMENLKKTLAAAGCTMADLVSATRFLTDVNEQDDLNRVRAEYLGPPRQLPDRDHRDRGHRRLVMAKLGWVGLGAMGSRLARRLLAAGHQVVGWNRSPDKVRDLVAAG